MYKAVHLIQNILNINRFTFVAQVFHFIAGTEVMKVTVFYALRRIGVKWVN